MTNPLFFLPIAYVACIVCVGIKRDTVVEIFVEGTRFFVIFTLGCAILSVICFFISKYLSAGELFG